MGDRHEDFLNFQQVSEDRRFHILFALAVFGGLYLLSLYNYLLFHTLSETFSVVIAFGMFVIAWNSRGFTSNNYLLFIGVGYLFAGGIDLLHALSYKGMGVFPGRDANLPTQLWIAARYLESITLLLAPWFLGRRVRYGLIFVCYALVFTLLLGSIFSAVFPVCFVEGVGLTTFKKISEYVISLILGGALFFLLVHKREFDLRVLRLLILSIIFTIFSELAFTFYIGIYDLANLTGHFFKIVSFYLIYRAIIKTGLIGPYNLIFRDLKRSEEFLQNAQRELEARVEERTAELRKSNELLKAEISERRRAQEALQDSEKGAQRLAHENAVLARMGRVISSTFNIEEVYKLFSEEVKKLLPFDRLAISLIDQEKNNIINRYVGGVSIASRNQGDVFPIAGTFNEAVIQSRQGIILAEEKEEEILFKYPGLLPVIQAGIKSFLSFPLISGDKVIGVIHFRSKKERAYAEKDFELAESIANQIAGAIANARLFDELHQTEETLRRSEEKYRLLVQNANDAIFIAQDGVIKFANTKTEELVGYSAAELARMPFIHHIHPDDQEMVLERHRRRLEGKAPSGIYSFRIRNKSGDQLWVELNSVYITWEERAATLNFLRNITEQKKLESQFLQAQKMEAIGRLAGGIAHDFNNLLNPIFINTDLVLLDAPLEDRMREYLRTVLKAAERGRDLVKQIITFSRQREQERRPLKAGPLIKEVLKFLRSSLPRTIEIRETVQKEAGYILADPIQIHQVMMNLCSNAAYAMREQGGMLEVNLAEVEVDRDMGRQHVDLKPGPYLRLVVTDTGIGMTPEVMERVFDPFFTTKSAGEGTGMGLSVVHGIVKSHGGAITVDSETGKGTTFKIFLPQLETEESLVEVWPQPLVTGQERILLVDDEEVQVASIRNMLERAGYKVVAKTDSRDALALFEKDPFAFDLVITDQTMPQMTGVRLTEELLRIRPNVPVILCSGFSEMVDANAAKASGICQYLMKPFSVREMAETIRRALTKK